MVDRCRACRFWKLDLGVGEIDPGEDNDAGFGWCRRDPPTIVEHVARMAIRSPGLNGEVTGIRDIADASRVYDATLFPATFGTNWCGRFEAAPC